jgi:hypothetical protein
MRCALLWHVPILKNAASGVAGGLRPLAVGAVLRRLASILVLHKALLVAADCHISLRSCRGRDRHSCTWILREAGAVWA